MRMQSFAEPPPTPSEPTRTKESATNWWILAGAAAAIGVTGVVVVTILYTLAARPSVAYGVVVDAGSSSSKLYAFNWPASKLNGSGVVSQIGIEQTDKPLESATGVQLVTQALTKLSRLVPADKRHAAPLYLGATAGMRLYNELNSTLANSVLDSARRSIQSVFDYKIENATAQIRIISGGEEGLGAWISVNYLKDSFGNLASAGSVASPGRPADYASSRTYGSLDMGGASVQIAFQTAENASLADKDWRHIQRVALYGKEYSVYAYSFLCYGKAQAEYRALGHAIVDANFSGEVYSPCLQRGFALNVTGEEAFQRPCSDGWFGDVGEARRRSFTVRGTGNFSACRSLIDSFFNVTECQHPACSFNGVHQPPPDGRFVALSSFFYTVSAFNGSGVGLDELNNRVRDLCQRAYVTYDNSYAKWYCFDGVYVIKVLGMFGFNQSNWGNLEFVDQIVVHHQSSDGQNSTSRHKVSWSLGFMIDQSKLVTAEKPLVTLSLLLFILLLVIFGGLLGFSAVFCLVAVGVRRRSAGYAVF